LKLGESHGDGGVRVWKVLRRGEKGIGVCRGGDNQRRERVVVEKRRRLQYRKEGGSSRGKRKRQGS